MGVGSYWEGKDIPITEEQLQSLFNLASMPYLEWCQCFENNLVEEYDIASYSFLVPPDKDCPICPKDRGKEWLVEDTIIQDHYHCSICTKLTQIG